MRYFILGLFVGLGFCVLTSLLGADETTLAEAQGPTIERLQERHPDLTGCYLTGTVVGEGGVPLEERIRIEVTPKRAVARPVEAAFHSERRIVRTHSEGRFLVQGLEDEKTYRIKVRDLETGHSTERHVTLPSEPLRFQLSGQEPKGQEAQQR